MNWEIGGGLLAPTQRLQGDNELEERSLQVLLCFFSRQHPRQGQVSRDTVEVLEKSFRVLMEPLGAAAFVPDVRASLPHPARLGD